ncbi:hypothetical protein EF847_05695 [Actinobacteria bacterium YIM 96077]|uniref:DUF1468 domain-containing protein n=1 Tax=Phytoactinopolyspora halophila TaxID=1981511 RepID=A0A329QSY4_9ACTN|nr:tripartite tricarboxylate transporter TctB family protein [Phytoactinopolyspora halophila]AYY12275.1 hypothetical protein EF847_05695 [Actinobacteria bacterium YIM 96077]RAW13808.1 hypothetical protein DPM12_12460 [Phytoactinopolyspora halophila]
MSSTERPVERPAPGPHVSTDLIAGMALLAIVAIGLLGSGEGHLDWLFPVTLSWILGAFGACLVVRGLLGYGHRVPAVPRLLRGQNPDVALFVGLVVVYVIVIEQVGFWLPSAAMLVVASVYLDTFRSRRNIAISVLVALGVCIVGYVVLTKVFFVPLPGGEWIPF